MVIDFISVPVTAGFVSAAALTIASGQIKSIFGLHIHQPVHIEGVHGRWIDVVKNWHTMRLNDSILGITCIVILLCLRAVGRNNWFQEATGPLEGSKHQTFCSKLYGSSEKARKFLKTACWVIGTARNAIIVILCTLLAYSLDPEIPEDKRAATFILTGNIDAGVPSFKVPPFSFKGQSFSEMVSALGPATIILPMIAILENVAMAKAFCKFCKLFLKNTYYYYFILFF